MTRRSDGRTGLGEIAAYGLGDLSFNLVWTMMLTYLVYYYTETCGIRADIAGLIVLGARVTNVVLDPLVGALVDRRPFGRKARPLVIWGAIPLGILTWLAFTTVSQDISTRTIWAAVTYSGLCIAYSIVNTPYGAMTTLISGNEIARGKLAVSRMVGATVGMLFIGIATLPLVDALGHGDRVSGFGRVAAIYGALVACGLLATGSMCRERTGGDAMRASFSEVIRMLAHNRAWIVITLSMSLYLIGQTFLFGMAPYYVLRVLHRPDGETGLLLTVLNILFLSGSIAALPLAIRVGSRIALLLGAVGGGILLLLLDILPHSMATTLWTIGAAGLLLGIAAPMSYVLLADSADTSGPQKVIAGVCYAANSAVCKISFGIGGYLMTMLLADGAHSQAWSAQRGFVEVSAAAFALSGLIMLFYPRNMSGAQ
jgi:GPH family glycoside/pentoside/hexuronide:cation symporter